MEDIEILPENGETPENPIEESFQIMQNEEIYNLNIKLYENKIILSIIEQSLPPKMFEINLTLEEIKAKHKKFAEFTTCQEILIYLKECINNSNLYIKKKEDDEISLELKQISISIDLIKTQISQKLKESNIYNQILLLKNDFNKIKNKYDNIIKDNKNMNKEINKIKGENENFKGLNKNLSNNINDLNKKINELNNELSHLKEQSKKQMEQIEQLKSINEYKQKKFDENIIKNEEQNNFKKNSEQKINLIDENTQKMILPSNKDYSSNIYNNFLTINKEIKNIKENANKIQMNKFTSNFKKIPPRLSEVISSNKTEKHFNKRKIYNNKEDYFKTKNSTFKKMKDYDSKLDKLNQTYKKEKSKQNKIKGNIEIRKALFSKKNSPIPQRKALNINENYNAFKSEKNNIFTSNNFRNNFNYYNNLTTSHYSIRNKIHNNKLLYLKKPLPKDISKENISLHNRKNNIFFVEENQNVPLSENNEIKSKAIKLNSVKKTNSLCNILNYHN